MDFQKYLKMKRNLGIRKIKSFNKFLEEKNYRKEQNIYREL